MMGMMVATVMGMVVTIEIIVQVVEQLLHAIDNSTDSPCVRIHPACSVGF